MLPIARLNPKITLAPVFSGRQVPLLVSGPQSSTLRPGDKVFSLGVHTPGIPHPNSIINVKITPHVNFSRSMGTKR